MVKNKYFKCPYCDKRFNKDWKVVNHIRQSRSGDHGQMGSLPEGFNKKVLSWGTDEVDTESVPEVKTEDENTDSDNYKVTVINPPKVTQKSILLCPDCNTPKTEWININQIEDASDDEKRSYDYYCPNCKELIKIDE